MDQYFKTQLTYTSDALEGNRFTLTETKILLEDGIFLAGRQMGDCDCNGKRRGNPQDGLSFLLECLFSVGRQCTHTPQADTQSGKIVEGS